MAGQPARLVGKGNEYFLRHLLGTDASVRAEEAAARTSARSDVVWRDEAPEGKLDLLLSLDFRMTSTTLLSDVVLPAATWYEKHDLNTTDMHPFVHAFTPAIDPPWETRTDFDTFHRDRQDVHRTGRPAPRASARTWWPCRCSTTPRRDGHSLAESCGIGGPARSPRCPGRTMPKFIVVERDYGAIADKWARSARCWTGSG